MSKLFTVIIMILTFNVKSFAQQMIPKQKGFEISYAIFPKSPEKQNYALSAGIISYGKNGKYFFGMAEYSRKYYKYSNYDIPIETFLLNSGYSFYLFGDTLRNFNFNFGISGLVGYEQVNRGMCKLDDGSILNETENFIYGAAGKLSLESYLTEHLVLTLNGQLRFLQDSQLGALHSLFGFGLRYNF